MGVPKFFRYISERYPCLSELVREYQIPEFDNLYLDMNGIIHMCSHPDDGDPHFRITEEKIFRDIFHYIEVLFRMIKPRKLFFMAVDGVAPRAKMNQQRGRRFRSAKEATTLEAKAQERGEILPTEARFDSNCITPGTVFMARLHEQLKYFVVNKISTDKLWRNCKIVLSGHETPGEGEHKIMDYIRYMRAQPGYDPNTRHCLYGLDADLIMLGLCTHEPHFSLLREEVRFGKKSNKRKNIPEQITFFLLHLSLMREYLELEFFPLKDSLKFEYDMEKIIDDWVLMGFLVGNDFIPHLPNMHIANGALPILYKAYMKVLPKLGGYINESGILNLERFEEFIQELSSIDIDNFTEKYADLKWFEAKTGRRFNEKEKPDMKPRKLEEWVPDDDDGNLDEPLEDSKHVDSGLAALIKATDDILLEPSKPNPLEKDEVDQVCGVENNSDTLDNEDDLFNAEFVQHKTDYYMNKLDYANVTPEVLRSQAEEYVRAIQWNLHYYYNGVCSWSWFYPHHYAPYVSDVKGFSNLTFNFELGEPFKPYEQLLAVLPAASKSFLPLPYQQLMTDEKSIIKEYYPEDFKTDLNGKKQEWEAVVLIPFIEEGVLLKAMAPCNTELTHEELQRNCQGPMLLYMYSSDDLGIYTAPEHFPAIKSSHALCEQVFIEDIRIPREKLVKGAYPGVKFDVYYPGFPTMKHLKYEGCLEKAKVKVFEQPSRGDNMILRVNTEDELPETDAIAKELLGKTVHVGWPHLVEALVISISNKEYRYHSAGEKGQYNVEENKGNLMSLWRSERMAIAEYYKNRLGVDVGDTEVLVHVKIMVGRKYVFTPQGRISFEKQWADITSAYPIQTVVRDITVYEEKYVAYKDIGSVFPMGSFCFMLGQPCYGLMAEVLDSKEALKNGRVKVCMKKYEEPDLSSIMQLDNEIRVRFMNLHIAATKLAISRSLFSRITGCVFVAPGRDQHAMSDDSPKINIGLNLKFNKKNEEVPGYTRKDGNTWLYSEKTIALVRLYIEQWPQIFEYLNYHVGNDVFYEEDIFPDGNAKDCLREITTWMKEQPFYSIERQVCGSSVLDPEVTEKLEQLVDEYNSNNSKLKQVVMQVRPHLLFKPELQMGNLMPDSAATFRLYDRVINIREGYTVPLGYKGTIIGVHKPSTSKESDTLYDVLFDQTFAGGLAINCSPNRGYRMPRPAVINISHGIRILQEKSGKPGQLQSSQNQGTLRNSYANNPMGLSQHAPNYPANNHFQPQNPMVTNWSRGCNFSIRPPAQPVQNFNQFNYNYNPNFNGPYAHPAYNSNYVNSPNYNNPGPNTFVPYKTNHFPLTAPLIQQHYVPPNNIPNVNLQLANGNEAVVPRTQQRTVDEKKGSKGGIPEAKLAPVKPIVVPVAHVTRSPTKPPSKMDSPANQFPSLDSDMLKKMLKINDNTSEANTSSQNKSKESDNKDNSTAISVADFFAHARSKEQQKSPQKGQNPDAGNKLQSSYYTARLLNEFQERNLGIPSYQYFKMNDNKFVASITMPNGASVLGEDGGTKEEASENAATEALKVLQQGNSSSERVNINPPSNAVPEPPKRWQNTPQPHTSQGSPQKTWSKSKPKVPTQENWRSEGKPEKPEKRERMKINQDHIYKHLNIDSTKATRSSTDRSENSKKHNSITITNSSFVPLQAVRQQRHRTSSSNASEPSTGKSNSPKQQSSKQEKQNTVPVSQPTANVPAAKTSSKPRRERKIRIAANFQTAMTQ